MLERASSTNGAGQLGQLHVKKIKLDHSSIAYTKIRSTWTKDKHVRPDTKKLLEKTQVEHSDINHSNIFF